MLYNCRQCLCIEWNLVFIIKLNLCQLDYTLINLILQCFSFNDIKEKNPPFRKMFRSPEKIMSMVT